MSKKALTSKIKDGLISMKTDYSEGGIKKLIRNKTFIILAVLFILGAMGSEEPATSVDSGTTAGNGSSNISDTAATTTAISNGAMMGDGGDQRQTTVSDAAAGSGKQQVVASQTAEEGSQSIQVAQASVTASEAPQYSDVEFFTIRSNMQHMTELQFKEYCKSLKGSRIKWQGYVHEIKEAWTGGYKITIDMDSPMDPLSGYDIDAFKISKETALALNKDQLVTFTGTIDSVLTILGTSVTVSLENAEIL